MHYRFPIIRNKGDISIEAMVEVFKAVFKGLLEVTWPARGKYKANQTTCRPNEFLPTWPVELMSSLRNLPKTVHLNYENGPVNMHEYLVWALGTQVQGHMLPLHPGKRCNHSEMIASSDIKYTDTSSLNTKRGFMKTIGQLHGFDYLSWVVQLPPWLVICKRIMIKVMLEQQSDSPFGLPQVTSVSPAGLVPAKRALLSLNLARKVRSLTNDGTRNRKIIFRGEVELSLLFSAVGPL